MPSGQCDKTFHGLFANVRNKLECLFMVNILSLMVLSNVRADPGGAPEMFSALPKNIRLGSKGLPGTNTLAY